ncbi:MAG TPA: FAD-dependent oxidoreductase [Candidatus Limiplasma sp.]|nr:FAD-dependent oxidoreductase [Candidatus Limiplasma sp.]
MEYDVIIAGGGVAGIAAALAAKRSGAKRVLLLERQYLLGGLATCGLVTIYLPLCDGQGRQVSFAIAEELLRLSVCHGAEGRYPDAWLGQGTLEQRQAQRYLVQFNPYAFAIDAEQLLQKEGVQVFYGAMISGVNAAQGRLQSIEIVTKSGRETLTANAFVDATGDADLFWLAGAPTAEHAKGNILASWYYGTQQGEYDLHPLGFCDMLDETPGAQHTGETRYHGLDARELSAMTVQAHRTLYADFLASGDIQRGLALTAVASIPQVRMTRRLAGIATPDERNPYAHEETSVGMYADWRKRGAAYELPFGALCSAALQNVFAAGRCISVTDAMWDITRVIPVCAVSGQAAGTAAALCPINHAPELYAVQAELNRQQVALHFDA